MTLQTDFPANFSLTFLPTCAGQTLGPGNTCVQGLVFAPTGDGTMYHASFTVTDPFTGGSVSARVSGTGCTSATCD